MQKIVPCLWFDNNAEEAAKFYVSIFKNSKILKISRLGKNGAKALGKPVGSVLAVFFRLGKQEYMALNGGPQHKLTQAFSLMVHCKDQKEIDTLSSKLIKGGGNEIACSWLKDKYGMFWQIVPEDLGTLIASKDTERSDRVLTEVWKMKRLNIKKLEEAYKKQT
jgi:predicted 3-demethylubiquinone-9 3-methyltransferase (glyoxalase superfamily)